MRMRLKVNQTAFDISSENALRDKMVESAHLPFREVWLNIEDGPALCALLNKKIGWLMYLREPGDSGSSSRNPSYSGSDTDVIEYRLGNGQVDEYPANWALSEADILNALTYFLAHQSRPTFIAWHDDG